MLGYGEFERLEGRSTLCPVVSEKFKVHEAVCLGGSLIPSLSETFLPVMLSSQGQVKCCILVDLKER